MTALFATEITQQRDTRRSVKFLFGELLDWSSRMLICWQLKQNPLQRKHVVASVPGQLSYFDQLGDFSFQEAASDTHDVTWCLSRIRDGR